MTRRPCARCLLNVNHCRSLLVARLTGLYHSRFAYECYLPALLLTTEWHTLGRERMWSCRSFRFRATRSLSPDAEKDSRCAILSVGLRITIHLNYGR